MDHALREVSAKFEVIGANALAAFPARILHSGGEARSWFTSEVPWGCQSLRHLWTSCWSVKGWGHGALLLALMAHPDQASSLQGSRRVSSDTLAVNNRTIGLGWQQSKRTLVLLAVVGACARPRWQSPQLADLTRLRLFLNHCVVVFA